MKLIFDAYAWIAYLRGGKAGESVDKLLTQDNDIYTCSINLAEVISKSVRERKDPLIALDLMTSCSSIISVDASLASKAGELHAETRKKIKDFGLADAFILAAARKVGAKIVTGDLHFKSFKEAIMIF